MIKIHRTHHRTTATVGIVMAIAVVGVGGVDARGPLSQGAHILEVGDDDPKPTLSPISISWPGLRPMRPERRPPTNTSSG